MTRIQAPPNLPALVKAAFQKARANGDLLYYPTQATILNVGSVPVSCIHERGESVKELRA